MYDEHRYDQCGNLGGMFNFLVQFAVQSWSSPNCRWPLSVKISLTYCTFSCGSIFGVVVDKMIYQLINLYFSLVKHFYQILYGLNGLVISWYHI